MFDNYVILGAIAVAGVILYRFWASREPDEPLLAEAYAEAEPIRRRGIIENADAKASHRFEQKLEDDLCEAEVERRETALDEARRRRRGKKLEEALKGPSA